MKDKVAQSIIERSKILESEPGFDALQYIEDNMSDVFTVLTPYTFGKTFPIRCNVCVSKRRGKNSANGNKAKPVIFT